jgi:hypothetical protein
MVTTDTVIDAMFFHEMTSLGAVTPDTETKVDFFPPLAPVTHPQI